MHLHDRGRHSKTTTLIAPRRVGNSYRDPHLTPKVKIRWFTVPHNTEWARRARPLPQPSRAPLVGAMSAQYSATLTSFHTASPDKDPYTIYVITVKRGAQQWQVFRRYREVLCRRARTPG